MPQTASLADPGRLRHRFGGRIDPYPSKETAALMPRKNLLSYSLTSSPSVATCCHPRPGYRREKLTYTELYASALSGVLRLPDAGVSQVIRPPFGGPTPPNGSLAFGVFYCEAPGRTDGLRRISDFVQRAIKDAGVKTHLA